MSVVITVRAGKQSAGYLRDLWSFRELFLFLAWRDILVRYKQTALGIAWSLLRPLLMMAAFVAVFGRMAKMPSGGMPYPILVFSALLPWQFFSTALSESSGSLVGNAGMISKVYFPRMLIPLSAIATAAVDFAISFVLLLSMMVWYGVPLRAPFLALPLFVLPALLASSGLGLLMAALNVKFRDFKYIVPFIAQVGLYISPVGFSTAAVPARWKTAYAMNPMVGVIDGFRWALTGAGRPDLLTAGMSLAVSTALFAAGFAYFKRTENTFADRI